MVIAAVAITAVVTLRWVNDAYMQDAALNEDAEQSAQEALRENAGQAAPTEGLQDGAEFTITTTDALIVEPGPLDHPVSAALAAIRAVHTASDMGRGSRCGNLAREGQVAVEQAGL
ncbi:hypothetical protein [Candidatus Nitrososphaera sp. FF02]|uniref:hypothetical protein n=1 Tax=Candidatus Nitrososphaera sp. FF02 TaxID=3398226 RepID=UPI0039ED6F64